MKSNETWKSWLRGDLDLTDTLPEAQMPSALEPAGTETSQTSGQEQPASMKTLERWELHLFQKLYPFFAVLMGLAIVVVLMATVFSLPQFGGEDVPANNEVAERYLADGIEETGAINFVAGMILDYRAFDTLGESHVLFTGVCAVILLLESTEEVNIFRRKKTKKRAPAPRLDLTKDPILHQAALFIVPIIFLFGIYVVFNGHLSPGGGFSGGAILGAGLIVYASAFGFEQTERFMNRKVFRMVTLCALCFYSLSKCYSFFTGANHLESFISPGTPGNIFSAGLILPLNIAVGAVVACTMYGLFSLFERGKI